MRLVRFGDDCALDPMEIEAVAKVTYSEEDVARVINVGRDPFYPGDRTALYVAFTDGSQAVVHGPAAEELRAFIARLPGGTDYLAALRAARAGADDREPAG